MVTLNPNVAADRYNKINTINWKPLVPANAWLTLPEPITAQTRLVDTILLLIRIWYSIQTTNGAQIGCKDIGFDVQSVALHEMGHTLGLGDLYGKPAVQV